MMLFNPNNLPEDEKRRKLEAFLGQFPEKSKLVWIAQIVEIANVKVTRLDSNLAILFWISG